MPYPNLTNQERTAILNFQDKVRTDPVWFREEKLGTKLWEKEKEIMLAVRDNSEVAVKSCNASGKTFTAAGIVHWWLIGHPNSVVITTAPTFRQVKEILWREIRQAVAGKHFYSDSAVLDTQINIADNWFALGLSTDRPDQFQGFHSQNLLVVVDEASGVPDVIYEAVDGLKPTKTLLIGNPMRTTGRFAKAFKEPKVKKISISAFDTPNIKEGRLVIPGLVSLEDINKFEQRYGKNSDVFRVRILGEFPQAESDTLISVDEVYQAINREVTEAAIFEPKMGVDVARFGDDRTIITIRQDKRIILKTSLNHKETMQITGEVMRIAKDNNIKPANIFIDGIGVGAGVVDRLKEQGWQVEDINVGMPANDEEHYFNLRAELYGKIKDWLKTAQLPKDDDYYELSNIKYKFSSTRGQLQLESKEDMKKRGLPSPDCGDSLALTFAISSLQSTAMWTTEQQTTSNIKFFPELGF